MFEQYSGGQQYQSPPTGSGRGYVYSPDQAYYQQPPQQPVYQQQPVAVPPVIGGYGQTSGPAIPGYHNYAMPQQPQMNMGYGYQAQPVQGFMNAPLPPSQLFPTLTGGSNMIYNGGPNQSIYANGNNGYNPYAYNGSNPYWRPQQTYDRVVTIPGVSTCSNPLITQEDIDRVHELYNQMLDEEDEAQDSNQFYNPYQYNYYGFGQNYWGMRNIEQKYDNQVRQILNEAQQRRIEWNKRLFRTAYNYLGEDYNEEELNKMCEGYQYTIPGTRIMADAQQDYLANSIELNPQDPSWNPYAQHFLEMKQIYENLTPATDNMNDFFRDLGKVGMYYEYTEETSRRRNGRRLYNDNGYRQMIRKAIKAREASERGENNHDLAQRMVDQINNNIDHNASQEVQTAQTAAIVSQMMSGQPISPPKTGEYSGIFNDIGKFGHFENGVLTLNDPPDWVGKRDGPIVENQMENEYEAQKDAFIRSIYAKNGG